MEPATRMHRAACGPLCAEAPSSSCRPFASAHVALLSATDAPALRRRRRVPTDASAPPHPGKVHATATAHTPMDTGWPSSRGSGDAAGIRSRGRRPCARHRPPHRAGGSGGGKCRRQGTGGRALRAGRHGRQADSNGGGAVGGAHATERSAAVPKDARGGGPFFLRGGGPFLRVFFLEGQVCRPSFLPGNSGRSFPDFPLCTANQCNDHTLRGAFDWREGLSSGERAIALRLHSRCAVFVF